MPDAAFDETEHQFLGLVEAGSGGRPVYVRRYTIASVMRGHETQQKIADRYDALEYLYSNPPDALIVTGAEPRCADIRMETYWTDLAALIDWAGTHVSSVLLSCLASHAALLVHDGIERTALPTKKSGVFRQVIDDADDVDGLLRGVDGVAYPHSRSNGVETAILRSHGYRVLMESMDSGWTVATGHRGDCSLVLFQGHPEYSRETLLREYRRDVRRFLEGTRATYPQVPSGYLDDAGLAMLERFKARATGRRAHPGLMADFPFEPAVAHIQAQWHTASARLIGNWLQSIELKLTARARR